MKFKILIVSVLLFDISACALRGNSSHTASSLVDYLYHDQQEKIIQTTIPRLQLPLNVGIAFVPGSYNTDFSEVQKKELMERVTEEFKQYTYVKSIQIIPSAYLRPQGSFTNLDQLRSMFGVDVITLLSYDQMQFTGEGRSAIAYWTIVGAYFVKGEKNDTHTMLDAAVYDIESRQLLFRAPGVSQVKSRSTLIAAADKSRSDNAKGMALASEDLIKNMGVELQDFEQRVKISPKEYSVTRTKGYSGGGSSSLWLLLLMMSVFLVRARSFR